MKYFLIVPILLFISPLSLNAQEPEKLAEKKLSFIVQSCDSLQMQALLIYLNRQTELSEYEFILEEMSVVADPSTHTVNISPRKGVFSLWVSNVNGDLVLSTERENIIGWIIAFQTGAFITN